MRGPSLFKKRRIAAVIEQMNEEAKEAYGIDGPIAKSDWKQGYAVVSAFDPSDVRKNKAYKILYDVYAPQIDAALKYDNPFKKVAAEATSLMLWETPGSFKIGDFVLKTKNHSPYYLSVDKLSSCPDFMNVASGFFQIEWERNTNGADLIAGGESRGIPIGTWFAKDTFNGVGIARKKPKEYGTKSKVEGIVQKGDVVALFEDLGTTGKSKIEFIDAIENSGGLVEDVFVIFDRQEGLEEALSKRNAALHTLTNMDTQLNVGTKYGYITDKELEIVNNYREDPKAWNISRGYEWHNPEE